MAVKDDIEATEAFAFLRVLAPKLEQLRRRLVASNELLKSADVETARVTAVVETQLALKDFLSGLSNFADLVEPIDILLGLLSEEEAAEPEIETPQAPAANVPPPKATTGKRQDGAVSNAWLRVGTLSAMDKLINAGMSTTGAETFVERVYDNIGLTHDGEPITTETIKEWCGPAGGGWRRKRTLVRKPGATQARGPAAVQEAQERVKEFALIFKKMAAGAGA